MEFLIRILKRFYEKNYKKIHQALRNIMLVLYVTFFTIVSFQIYYSFSLTNVEDYFYQQGIERNKDVIVVGITDEDIQYFGNDATDVAATVVLKLNNNSQYAPAAIGFDIPLSDLNTDTKEKLITASKKHDNVVLVAGLGMDEGMMLDSYERDGYLIVSESELIPDEELLEQCDLGHNAKITDKNFVLRHAVFDITGSDGTVYRSIASVCYEKYCKTNNLTPVQPKLSKQNTAIIKFSRRSDDNIYSAKDVLLGKVNYEDLNNKIVLIGHFSNSLDQGYATSIDYTVKAHTVQIDADIVNALIEKSFAKVIDYRIQLHVLIVCIFVIALFTLKCSFLGGVCINVLYMLLLFVFAVLTYGIGYQTFVLPHIVSSIITSLIFGFIGYNFRTNEKEKIYRNTLSRYLDDNNIGSIIEQASESDMGVGIYKEEKVKSRNIAVLFADIRRFTTICENMEAKELVSMLNEYLSMMAECVVKYGGTLDKFIGDCAMAYWGSPTDDEDAVYHACLAACEMQRKTKEVLSKVGAYKDYHISIGIGINYGEAVVGNIGSINRMNFTAIGDTVNTASRIEEIADKDEILISEAAYQNLKKTIEPEVTLMKQSLVLRGRERMTNIYRLESVPVADIKKGTDEDTIIHTKGTLTAAIVNFVVALIQLVFSVSFISEHGLNTLPYFNVILAVLSGCTLLIMTAYDISKKVGNSKEYRPHWLNILFLMALAGNLKTFIAFVIRGIPKYGFSVLSSSVWAGGIVICFICPLLVVFSFFFLEYPVEYRIKDVVAAEAPLAILLFISTILSTRAGLDVKNPDLYEIYFKFPLNFISVIFEFIGVYMLTTINKYLKLQEKMGHNINERVRNSIINSKVTQYLRTNKGKKIVSLLGNILMLALSLIPILMTILSESDEIFSNSCILSILVCFLTLTIIVIQIFRLDDNRRYKQRNIYAYIVFGRMLCTSVNLFSAIILSINDNSIMAFFAPHWGYHILTYLIVPMIGFVLSFVDVVECKFPFYIFCTALPLIALFVSKLAIEYHELYEVSGIEYDLYLKGGQFYLSIAFEFGLCLLLNLVNTMVIRVSRYFSNKGQHLAIRFAGSRYGIAGYGSFHSEFGKYTECYIMKDNNYAIVIGTGSGLIKAKDALQDCTHIDIFVINEHFDGISGFLAVPKINPYASVRIFSMFDFNTFPTHPFWPVDIIEGSRIRMESNHRIRLNSIYSAEMIPTDDANRHILKVYTDRSIMNFKEVAVAFVPDIPSDKEVLEGLRNDTYALVCMDVTKWKEACELAIQCTIPKLFITGYSSRLDDEEVLYMESKAKRILKDVIFVRKGKKYEFY